MRLQSPRLTVFKISYNVPESLFYIIYGSLYELHDKINEEYFKLSVDSRHLYLTNANQNYILLYLLQLHLLVYTPQFLRAGIAQSV